MARNTQSVKQVQGKGWRENLGYPMGYTIGVPHWGRLWGTLFYSANYRSNWIEYIIMFCKVFHLLKIKILRSTSHWHLKIRTYGKSEVYYLSLLIIVNQCGSTMSAWESADIWGECQKTKCRVSMILPFAL